MSKSTMADRAAARVKELGPLGTISPPWLALQLEQFAAAEVARVREMQLPVIPGLRRAVGQETAGQCLRGHELLDVIDEATRPERPARAKAKRQPGELYIDRKGVLKAEPLSKAAIMKFIDDLEKDKAERARKPGLSALARTVKKRGRR